MKTISFENHTCFICNAYICVNRRSLGNHLARSHKEIGGLQGYVLKFFFDGNVPQCKCGCGKQVNWHKTFYHFNDYVSGHNPGGFSADNQPKWTPEQIQKRNEAIKETYRSNKNNVKEKVSVSVSDAFSKPEHKLNLSNARKKQWQDDVFKEKASVARKKVWADNREELYEKIFTPQMRQKISESNLRRDLAYSSKEEHEFINKLKLILGNDAVSESPWINFPQKAMKPDGFLVKENVFLEWDGLFWHGFDRSEDFCVSQLQQIANDIKKNRLIRDSGKSYARFKSDIDLSGVTNVNSLLEHAYHLVIDGKVLKEGTFSLKETQPLISRETLIKTNEVDIFPDAKGREYTKTTLLPLVINLLKEHVDYWGWFYPTYEENDLGKILQNMSKLKVPVDGVFTCEHKTGSSFLKSMFKSFWNVQDGPKEAFKDIKALHSVVSYRLGLNNSKPYEYKLSNDQIVSCKETFDITLKNIRTGFVVQRHAVSFFKPTTAAQIWKSLLKNKEQKTPKVWDPSSGFGARLLGFAGVFPQGTYIGTEPAQQTWEDNILLFEMIKKLNQHFDCHVMKTGSEFFNPDPETLDAVFTSPPYFDVEKYFDEPGQCWKDHPTLDLWIENYLKPTFKNAFIGLKKSCKMAININLDLRQAVIDAALSVGFSFVEEWKLHSKRDHFMKRAGITDKKYEPILVFSKP